MTLETDPEKQRDLPAAATTIAREIGARLVASRTLAQAPSAEKLNGRNNAAAAA